jgi:hypothetical protein
MVTALDSTAVSRLRRSLGVVAAAWLIGRMATFALAPAALGPSAVDASGVACQCLDGADATCPMHHPITDGRSMCAMRAAAPVDGAILVSLLGSSGCLVPMATAPADGLVGSLSQSTTATLPLRFAPPDSPPPRT